MIRPILLLASRYQSVAEALHEVVDLFLPSAELTHKIKHVSFNCAAELFEALDDLPPKSLLNTMVLFDLGAEDETVWNMIQMKGERGLATRLVLSYPEVYFAFIGASGGLKYPQEDSEKLTELGVSIQQQANTSALIEEHHFTSGKNLFRMLELVQLHAQGFRTLFDATGLRSLLKFGLGEILAKLPEVRAGLYRHYSVSRLQHVAAVAEEEAAFLYLNGYAAYKFGFRSWLAHTNKEFSRLARDQSSPSRINAENQFVVSIMDWHLAYRDDEESSDIKRESLREIFLNEQVDGPIIVTSFPHSFYLRQSPIQRLSKKVKEWRQPSTTAKDGNEVEHAWTSKSVILSKPYGGFFDLLRKTAENGSKNPCSVVFNSVLESMANDIKQPTRSPVATNAPIPHSAPHAFSVVVERLLNRSQELKTADPIDTESWIQAAMLAGEAKEVLGGLSLTTTYQALALQNEAEVRAEVSFYGMSVEVEVERRLNLLDKEVLLVQRAATSGRFKERREDVAARLNCLLLTAHNLRMQFSECEQVDAAEHCLRRFAKHQRKLKRLPFTSEITRYPGAAINWLVSLPAGYPEYATDSGTSVKKLVGMSMFWIVFFSIGFFFLFTLHPHLKGDIRKTSVLALGHSFFTFVQLQPGLSEAEQLKEEAHFGLDKMPTGDPAYGQIRSWHMKWLLAYWTLLSTELVLAYLHLGLLVSVLYRRITRRAP